MKKMTALLIATAMSALLAGCGEETPSKSLQAFFEAASNADSAAVARYSDDAMKAIFGGLFEKTEAREGLKNELKKMNFRDAVIADGVAAVPMTVRDGENERFGEFFFMRKSGSHWKFALLTPEEAVTLFYHAVANNDEKLIEKIDSAELIRSSEWFAICDNLADPAVKKRFSKCLIQRSAASIEPNITRVWVQNGNGEIDCVEVDVFKKHASWKIVGLEKEAR